MVLLIWRLGPSLRQLPENRGEFEYRIKNLEEAHERVARESELTRALDPRSLMTLEPSCFARVEQSRDPPATSKSTCAQLGSCVGDQVADQNNIRGSSIRRSTMARGTVKWFNPTKGYGFIQPQGGGGRDVFVHISAVERAGMSTLNEGQQIEYEIEENRGKTSAVNLKVK
jgi:CspA family cold shock protein